MPELTILIVDDIEANRRVLREILKRKGYRVAEAASGPEALDAIANTEVDLALLDIMMPGMDGYELCRKIRETKSATDLPILFVTAKVEDKDLVDGLAAGANDYVTKPINAAVLTARLDAQLRLLQAMRALKVGYDKLTQRKRMETVGLFAAGVAHNFNNILGTIMGSAELIQLYAKGDPQINKAVELINRAGHRGAEVTDALLTFTRQTDAFRCNNPASVLQAAVVMLPLVSGSRVNFKLNIQDKLPAVELSPATFSHLIGELLQNGVDAIEGEGTVTLSAHSVPSGDGGPGYLSVKVRDTGRGMSQETAERLFEPFYTTKNLDTVLGIALDGSGLGLSVVYNLAANAGGDVRVIETSKDGTTIELRLPAAISPSASSRSLPAVQS